MNKLVKIRETDATGEFIEYLMLKSDVRKEWNQEIIDENPDLQDRKGVTALVGYLAGEFEKANYHRMVDLPQKLVKYMEDAGSTTVEISKVLRAWAEDKDLLS